MAIMTSNSGKERIYVGGLDPSRGLTVELVASRLCSVKEVNILTINDVSVKDSKHLKHGESIYKLNIVDEDGDMVDTRNFFFLEAQCTSENASSSSALETLAKQYNGVKWKGCQLRVEAAKPHFLQRLEEERALKQEKERVQQSEESKEEITNEDNVVVKNRRRLRIRKRFGEEAYRVDTHPHPLTLSQQASDHGGGWEDFAVLHKRMLRKRQSQQSKLVERRKKERRLWASGKDTGKNHPNNTDENDGLRSLMFLNRAIHIRFSDALDQEASRETVMERVEDQVKSAAEESDNESVTSSSVVSSDSEESSEDQGEAKGERKSYVWSDDDDDGSVEDQRRAMSSEESGESSDENHYRDNKDGRKWVERSDEYTKAVAINEFSGGVDFGESPDMVEGPFMDSEDDIMSNAGDSSSEHCIEDDDIRSNMNILSQLLPGEHFEQHPLADSISSTAGNDGADQPIKGQHSSSLFGTGLIMQRYDPKSDKRFELTQADKTSSDNAKCPATEEMGKDKDSEEVSVREDASVSSESSGEDKSTEQDRMEEQDSAENPLPDGNKTKLKRQANVEGKVVPAKDVYEQDKLEDVFRQAREGKSGSFSLANLFQDKAQTTADDDVYEQDKLEDIFKQARGDDSDNVDGRDFSFGFQSQLPEESAPFSFGFNASATSKSDEVQSSPQKSTKHRCDEHDVEVDAGQTYGITKGEVAVETKDTLFQRKRRKGMSFPESDLDKYEEMFFSLNEGPQILKDFNAMKQDEANKEQWQKEREVLTADWKRKQKSASSRKVKKVYSPH